MSESIEANINATVFPSTLNQGINLAKKSTVATFTAIDMKKQKLIDDIIPEPLGGVHRDKETMFKTVEKYITKSYKELKDLSTKDLVAQRMDKYCNMGEFSDK